MQCKKCGKKLNRSNRCGVCTRCQVGSAIYEKILENLWRKRASEPMGYDVELRWRQLREAAYQRRVLAGLPLFDPPLLASEIDPSA
jgi:hypothetical protein